MQTYIPCVCVSSVSEINFANHLIKVKHNKKWFRVGSNVCFFRRCGCFWGVLWWFGVVLGVLGGLGCFGVIRWTVGFLRRNLAACPLDVIGNREPIDSRKLVTSKCVGKPGTII